LEVYNPVIFILFFSKLKYKHWDFRIREIFNDINIFHYLKGPIFLKLRIDS